MLIKKPVIAIDIDEVLARHNHGLANWHNSRYGTQLTEHDFVTGNQWSAVLKVNEEETERRAVQFHNDLEHGKFEVMEGASQAIPKLSQHYDLVIVTIRRDIVIPTTHAWLNTHFPAQFKDVHFVRYWETGRTLTKLEVCQKAGAVCLIDDNLQNCQILAAAGISAILFGDSPWNQAKSLPANIRRANDWDHVLELLDV